MYDHALNRIKKHFCHYCLQAFGTEEKLKYHTNDTSTLYYINILKLMENEKLKCLKKVNMLNSKIMNEKIKTPFMIYADYESILVPKNSKRKIQMNLIRTNIENKLLAAIVIS